MKLRLKKHTSKEKITTKKERKYYSPLVNSIMWEGYSKNLFSFSFFFLMLLNCLLESVKTFELKIKNLEWSQVFNFLIRTLSIIINWRENFLMVIVDFFGNFAWELQIIIRCCGCRWIQVFLFHDDVIIVALESRYESKPGMNLNHVKGKNIVDML